MLGFLIVAFSAICSTQGTALIQQFKNLHLHARFGADLPEYGPPNNDVGPIDHLKTQQAEQFFRKHIPQFIVHKEMYGPIENVVIPGVTLPRPINLKKISITGLSELQLKRIQWRMALNRVMCTATSPYVVVEVTFDNVEIELDESFDHEKFNTSIHLTLGFQDLELFASARYNDKAMPTEQDVFIDKAEVDINAKEVLVKIEVQQGLEEIRSYVLSQIFNNPLEDILDAVLKVFVKEINKELLGEVKAQDISITNRRYDFPWNPKNSRQ